ncbi:hypothetical protein AtNW77_Chr4g0308981 [Arabidopsis thaliana]|uniref:Uncharacterized protein n=2 Tax=Arabidopsis TaxID=3701 RepID=A0A178V159_ARATH|nr:hypothetical protein ISN45_At04g032540 [Arabidopsis thaliana x Arabidopsis arenosa]OAO99420.1 hypothetical protein AXX17_AT4G35240 [Arabidopsis thaliana]CAA0397053.1 unnamed protein product [Arabidopsis thaliana]VYS64463.1 unnamed protein product [Arabidopsis thaliana]
MSSFFPLPPAIGKSTGCGVRDESQSLVVWAIEDYSIPESIDPDMINLKIETAIVKKFNLRSSAVVTTWIFGSAENAWLAESKVKLWESEFRVSLHKGGDKRARLNMMLADVIYYVWNWKAPTNLAVLTENKEEMEQDPKFFRFRQALENKGFFVAVEHPETLINQETAVEDPPDDSPIPYYPSDNPQKLAFWYKEDSEAYRAKYKQVRGTKRTI